MMILEDDFLITRVTNRGSPFTVSDHRFEHIVIGHLTFSLSLSVKWSLSVWQDQNDFLRLFWFAIRSLRDKSP